MGNTNSFFRHSQEVFSPPMGAPKLERSTTTLTPHLVRTEIEEKIKQSKAHWSQRVKFDSNSKGKQVTMATNVASEVCEADEESDESDEDEEPEVSEEEAELAKVSNREEFKTLQAEWGSFFYTFGDGELVMDDFRFAAGSQAELYGAQVEWRSPNWRKELQREGVLMDPPEYVLKVFRKGTYLRDLKSNLPRALLDFHQKRAHEWTKRRYNCDVVCATLLEDGRFAFLLQREDEDLRALIDRHMKMRTEQDHGPFRKEEAECLMYEVANGMNWLHEHDIVHRDLKASNVLVTRVGTEDDYQMCCFVTDYECSVGVEGTGFWRAPEILQAFKDAKSVKDCAGIERCRRERAKLFTKEADVYSYGMTCYEILTGRLPFEGKSVGDFDLVLNGQPKQPLEVPEYVDDWARELLCSCWQFNRKDRPSFGGILNKLRNNSAAIRDYLGMDGNMVHSKKNWSQDKTQLFTKSELLRQVELIRARAIQAGEIIRSVRWSLPSEADYDSDREEAEAADNLKVFETLQMHPLWGSFFQTFGYDLEYSITDPNQESHESLSNGTQGQLQQRLRAGELVVGDKCATGGQADIFHAHVTWTNPEMNEYDLRNGREWVIKVYKKGSLLRHLHLQWPEGMLQFQAERMEFAKSGATFKWKKLRNVCEVVCGTLLEDGRFANLLERHQGDLREFIERNMQLRYGYDYGPFSKAVAEGIMYDVALGMDWLHRHNIIHRDLKAANVLISVDNDGDYQCFVCDYECSIGVSGTGFWRAPEILQALKEMVVTRRREIFTTEIFTKAIDVYSYGMTCYEILTGQRPFEEIRPNEYDLVLNGQRPAVPLYVEDWTCELLNKCWQCEPEDRPSFGDILNIFQANSSASRGLA